MNPFTNPFDPDDPAWATFQEVMRNTAAGMFGAAAQRMGATGRPGQGSTYERCVKLLLQLCRVGGGDGTHTQWREELVRQQIILLFDSAIPGGEETLEGVRTMARNWRRALRQAEVYLPPVGPLADSVTRMRQVADDLELAADTVDSLQTRMHDVAVRIVERAIREISLPLDEAGGPETLDQCIEQWARIGDECYQEAMAEDGFSRDFGDLMNAGMRARLGIREEVDTWTRVMGLPSRGDFDRLESEVGALRRHLGSGVTARPRSSNGGAAGQAQPTPGDITEDSLDSGNTTPAPPAEVAVQSVAEPAPQTAGVKQARKKKVPGKKSGKKTSKKAAKKVAGKKKVAEQSTIQPATPTEAAGTPADVKESAASARKTKKRPAKTRATKKKASARTSQSQPAWDIDTITSTNASDTNDRAGKKDKSA